MESGAFAVLVAFLCALFYTLVNAQPLNPPFFVFAFLFFHISADFRVLLADALGQIRSILDRLWCHFELLQRLRKKILKKLAGNLQRTIKKLTRNAKNLQRTSNKPMRKTFPKAKSQAAYSILRRDSNRNKPPAIKEGGGGTRACALGYIYF